LRTNGKIIHGAEENAKLKAELESLRKEYATFALEVNELATQSHPDGFEAPGVLDDEVGALMKYWRHPIGECAKCGARAPLSEGRCAWGCGKGVG
jgi:hypothetical protein